MRLPSHPLLKQLAGAAIGALVALVIYSAYKAVEPQLGAYINVYQPRSGMDARFSQENLDDANKQFERRVQRNLEVLEHRSASAAPGTFEGIAERAREIEQGLTPRQQEDILQEPDQGGDGQVQGQVASPEPADGGSQEALPADLLWQQEMEEVERVPYEGGEELPGAGVGASLVGAMALAGAMAWRKRKKKE